MFDERRAAPAPAGSTDPAAPLTAPLRAAIGGLVAVDPEALSDSELGEAMVELRRQQARLAAATVRLTAAFDARRVWTSDGSRSAAAWLAHRCRRSTGDMRAEVRVGRRLRQMPVTRDAFAAGEVAEPHAQRLAGLSVGRTAECFARDEAMLVAYARGLSWPDFCRAAEYWRHCADPDGAERDTATDQTLRRVDLSEGFRGTGILSGALTPLARAALQNALWPIERELWAADWAQARADHGPDASPAQITRTSAQRRHDALVELAHRAWTAPNGGKRPRPLVSVLVGYETFAQRVCELADGTVITPGVVASMLSQVDIERVVFDSQNRVTDLGRQRSFVGAARRALEVEERHCGHGGCDVPADKCQGDHIDPYSHDGPTQPGNGQLRCGYHNRWRWQHPDGPDPPADA